MNQTRTMPLEIHIVEKESTTTADAALRLDSGKEVRGHGEAHRHPMDRDLPQVGDELAAARALSALSHQLIEVAADEIGRVEHRAVHLTH